MEFIDSHALVFVFNTILASHALHRRKRSDCSPT